jgi:hypothetical protein
MDTSIPDLRQPGCESFGRLGIFLPAGDEPSAPPLKAGGNACTVAGCHCPYFMGDEKATICENCGHHYSAHW